MLYSRFADQQLSGLEGAAYARYSTEHQCSIEAQFAQIRQYCEQTGVSLAETHMYEDEALSGMRKNRRKGFRDLLTAAEAGEFDVIVLYDLTRGSRDVVDWFSFRKDMRRLGIRVVSVIDRLGDLDNPSDFLTELMTVGMGQTHVLTSRRKSMDKIDMLAQQGKFLGGFAPLGYAIQNGAYVIVDSEAQLVQTMFRMYAAGASYAEILAAMPQGMRGRRGRPIGKNSLFEILRNDRYIGRYSWCKREMKYMTEWAGGKPSDRAVVIDGIIPPIIDTETWEKVRKRMEENKKNKLNKSRCNRQYLLTGLLRCGHCGAALVGVTTINKKGYEYKFYTCGAKRRGLGCKAKNIAANDIEPLLCALLRKSVLDGSMIEATADAIIAAAGQKNSASEAAALKAERASLEARLNNLVDAIAEGFDSPSVRQKIISAEDSIKRLDERLAALKPQAEVTRAQLIGELSKDIHALQENPDCIKELLRKYILSVDVYDDLIDIHSTADLAKGNADVPFLATKTNYAASGEADGVITDGECE